MGPKVWSSELLKSPETRLPMLGKHFQIFIAILLLFWKKIVHLRNKILFAFHTMIRRSLVNAIATQLVSSIAQLSLNNNSNHQCCKYKQKGIWEGHIITLSPLILLTQVQIQNLSFYNNSVNLWSRRFSSARCTCVNFLGGWWTCVRFVISYPFALAGYFFSKSTTPSFPPPPSLLGSKM